MIRRRLLTLSWLLVIGLLTLTSAPDQVARVAQTPWTCLSCGDAGTTDIILNLLLFLPLGLLLRLQGLRLRTVLVIAALFSSAIELTQGQWLVGRDASLGDVLANTLGAVAGWGLLPMLIQAMRPSVRFATNAAVTLLVVTSLIWFGTGTGLRPSLSGIGPYVGQPVRLWAGHDRFHGRFVGASIDGIVVEDDPLAALPTRRDALDLTLTVRASDTILSPRKVSLLRIVDGRGKSQLSVTARGADLVVDFPVDASRWGLRTPAWLFAMAARIPADTAWRWHWTAEAGRLAMQSGLPGGERAAGALPLSIGMGWVFVHPFAPAVDGHAGWWTALWLAWWMGLLGWFAGRLGWRTTFGFGVVALLSMVTASMLSGIPSRGNELLLAAVAFALAAVTTRAMKREQENRG